MNTQDMEEGSVTPAEDAIGEVEAQAEDTQDSNFYREELERVQKKLSKAEHTLKTKNIESKKSDKEVPEESAEALMKLVDQRFEDERVSKAKDVLAEEIESLTEDPDERDLIMAHYEGSIKQTGSDRASIQDDIRKAHALANARKFEKTNTELTESLKAKGAMGNSARGSNQSHSVPGEDLQSQFSPQDWQFIQDRGWDDEKIKKAALNKRAASK